MSGTHSVGVDVGGTKIAYGLFDHAKALVTTRQQPTPQHLSSEAFVRELAKNIQSLCVDNGVDAKGLLGVGIGLPCFIRKADGHVIKSSNIPALRDVPAKAMLTELLGVPVQLDNDGHAAALAESRHGAGRGFSDMLYCAVSSGIGSTPIIDGKLFSGSYGFSGESGHMLITPDVGELCACGKRGCFMSWCSGHMIVKHVQRWILTGGQTAMLDLAGNDPQKITTYEIKQAFDQGDAMAARAIEQMQKYLSLWLFDLYAFTNISCFVLGGGLLKLGREFWAEVERRFHALDDCGCEVYFKPAEMGDNTGIVGANELLY